VKADRVPYAVVLLIGAILAAVYCFRIIYYMFFQPGEEGAWRDQVMDAPAGMLAPTWALSLATLFFGVFSYLFLDSLLKAAASLLA
jgi:multicomponent Na+:H+ antiporter subunit D